jgi:DNA-binding transcriptional MerR regulator
MPETLNTRVTRLEEAMVRLANVQAYLAEVQAQDQTELREMKKEALERERRLDERIEKLVSDRLVHSQRQRQGVGLQRRSVEDTPSGSPDFRQWAD